LPDLRSLRVLDLGCGFGWFCLWARKQGSAAVLGIDVSEKMLTRASEATRDPAIAYTRATTERLELLPDSFDLVYSSLALHYVERLDRLMAIVYRSLAPGGSLVFSVEHPICTAPVEPGWSVNSAGHKTWPTGSSTGLKPRFRFSSRRMRQLQTPMRSSILGSLSRH
jgi:ubiquinone/menaquinone biosynthesis C-methylase UbiE